MVYSVLADLLLVLHFSIVLFLVGGLTCIWIGFFRNWMWVRNFNFRILHVLSMGFVVLESYFGWMCPLTTWENQLRLKASQPIYEDTFVSYWVHRIMFYQFSEQAFTIIYSIFFALMLISFIILRPRVNKTSS
jgi:hypothetical protein